MEVNYDGIVGPTHNYGGLARGNLASMEHSGDMSNPKAAALQGLEKMQLLQDLGVPQATLPPHYPDPKTKSAASMWVANAATVTTTDKVHITPANMLRTPHRKHEWEFNKRLFEVVFVGPRFIIHDPVDSPDEGAANHVFFSNGLHLFVHGSSKTTKFSARQTFKAQKEIVTSHGIENAIFLTQSPEAIDAGVFHNDVISTGHDNLFLMHEKAFTDFRAIDVETCIITEAELPLNQAVSTYLFNSQIVTSNGKKILIAPEEARELSVLKKIPVDEIYFVDLHQSMANGGGPACLRLRIDIPGETYPLKFEYAPLKNWVEKHYRDRLAPTDLQDPNLENEVQTALDELTQILKLGSLYDFQKST